MVLSILWLLFFASTEQCGKCFRADGRTPQRNYPSKPQANQQATTGITIKRDSTTGLTTMGLAFIGTFQGATKWFGKLVKRQYIRRLSISIATPHMVCKQWWSSHQPQRRIDCRPDSHRRSPSGVVRARGKHRCWTCPILEKSRQHDRWYQVGKSLAQIGDCPPVGK